MIMTRKLQFFLTALLLMVGVTRAWADDPVNLLSATNLSVSAQQSKTELAEGNKVLSGGTLTLKSLAASELTLKFDFDAIDIDASKCYVILETNTGVINTGGTFKARNITIDSNLFDNGNGADKSTTTSSSHNVILLNPMGKNAATISSVSTQMLAYYASNIENVEMKLTSIGFNVPISSTGDLVIYRIGLYNIAEIESLYSNPAMRFKNNNSHSLYLEFGGTANQVKVNSNTITLTHAESAVFLKSMGSLPDTYTLVDVRGITFSDTEAPFKKDMMTNLSNVNKILVGTGVYNHFPTNNTNVYLLGSKHYAYKDGSLTVSNKQDGTTNTYYNYTRNFKAGYNSCVLPFDVTISELPTGLSAWVFGSATAEGEVTFTPASGTLSAGTPCIIKADEAGLYLIPAASTSNVISSPESYYATSASNNIKFVGSFVNEVPSGSCTNYGITTDGTKFAKMANTTKTNYYRAFISDQRSGSGIGYAPAYLNVNFGGITGISDIEIKQNVMENDNAPIYNLNGVRMNADNLPKGIYIKNGKKFVIK